MVPKESKPYRVVCISVYVDELEQWDAMVKLLRRRGLLFINRSSLLREVMKATDVETIVERCKSGPT